MPLYVCPSCRCHVDASASSCPHCGAGRSAILARAALLGALVGASLGACNAAYGLPSTDYTDKTDTAHTSDTGPEQTTEDTGTIGDTGQ